MQQNSKLNPLVICITLIIIKVVTWDHNNLCRYFTRRFVSSIGYSLKSLAVTSNFQRVLGSIRWPYLDTCRGKFLLLSLSEQNAGDRIFFQFARIINKSDSWFCFAMFMEQYVSVFFYILKTHIFTAIWNVKLIQPISCSGKEHHISRKARSIVYLKEGKEQHFSRKARSSISQGRQGVAYLKKGKE